MNEFNIALGKRIRKLRERCGFTREKLSELADINDKFLYEIEMGKKGVTAQKLYRISSSLGVTMDFLASGEDIAEYQKLSAVISGCNENELDVVDDLIRLVIKLQNKYKD